MSTPARLADIVWIVTTQWRAQAAGYAGDANARTPCIDELASHAVNYRQAVTPHPFGPFARAAMLTGVASPENGVCDYFDRLPDQARTIAHDMAARGYETGYFGKWHLSRRDPAAPLVGDVHAKTLVPPESRGGFSFWEGFEGGFLLNDPWLHGSRLSQPTRFPGYQSDVVCSRAAEWWMDEATHGPLGKQPRFMVVSLESPHPPYHAPASGVPALVPTGIHLSTNVPRGGATEERARRELSGYYAHIEATGRAIGRLLRLLGNRVFTVFTSVHGDMHGAHGLFRKGWPYDEAVRIPFLVNGPGLASGVTDEAVSLIDLPQLTTSLADTGSLPKITEPAARISMPSVVHLPDQCDRAWYGTRSPTAKTIFNTDGTRWLEFDLRADPFELHNLTPL